VHCFPSVTMEGMALLSYIDIKGMILLHRYRDGGSIEDALHYDYRDAACKWRIYGDPHQCTGPFCLSL